MSDEPDLTRRATLQSLILPARAARRGTGSRPERGRRPHAGRLPLAQRQHAGDRRPAPAAVRRRSLRDPHRRALSRRLRGDRRAGERELDAAATPPLAERVAEIGGYETVFLGFPIWGMALPAPVRTFLTTHDLAGKTLVPFITHGGYGTGAAPETVAELAPQARIVAPFVLEADQERATMNAVAAWLGPSSRSSEQKGERP